jgi:hypothetical protein
MPADPCPAWGKARAGEMVGPIHPGRGAHASNATQLARNGPRLVHTGCQERRAQASQEEVEPRLHRASSRERASDMRSSARGRACPCPCPCPLSMALILASTLTLFNNAAVVSPLRASRSWNVVKLHAKCRRLSSWKRQFLAGSATVLGMLVDLVVLKCKNGASPFSWGRDTIDGLFAKGKGTMWR